MNAFRSSREHHERQTTPETEQNILRALKERLSIEATARLLKVAKKTIYRVLKKNAAPLEDGLLHPKRDAIEADERRCLVYTAVKGHLRSNSPAPRGCSRRR